MFKFFILCVLALIFWIRYQGIERQKTETTADLPFGKIRLGMQKNLMSWLPGDTGPLASGILLDGNEGLSYSTKAAFRKSGLMHVTAASGYNVVVVASWMMVLGKFIIGRRKAIWLGIASVAVYMLLAGLSTAVVRAGIMAELTLLASFWGRKTDAGWILILTSLVMLTINPVWIEDIGFQLSVAATAGLLYLTGPGNLLISDLKTTVAAQVATAPLILHHFGNLSMVSPIVNLMVLWTIPIIMQITAMAVLAGVIFKPLGGLIALLAYPLLAFLEGCVIWSADWPGASLNVGKLGWEWVGMYYLVVILLKPKHKNETVV